MPRPMKPWPYESAAGGKLWVAPGGGSRAMLTITAGGAEAEVLVDALDVPEVTVRLWEAVGQEPPVMLGRPELPGDGTSAEVAGFRLWTAGGTVQYEAPRTGEMAPHAARRTDPIPLQAQDAAR